MPNTADPAPIAVALDAPDAATMVRWAELVAPHVSTVKVGLESYLRDGAAGVAAVQTAAPNRDLFLDLKLHDIPNTVAGAARSLAHLEPKYLTVHASGGVAMIEAATTALPGTLITAVTVLTSLSPSDLAMSAAELQSFAVALAIRAVGAGAGAIVCSPHEVAAIRAAVGPTIVLVTPGLRPAGAVATDQARIATPAEALAAGADLLVIGRPITAAADPGAAAAAIAAEIGRIAPVGSAT